MSVDKIFEALSSAPRRRILAYLSKTDMTAGEIAQRFSAMMSQPAISKHLSMLENAGLEMAREAQPECALWARKRRTHQHACACPGPRYARARVPSGKTAPRPSRARERKVEA